MSASNCYKVALIGCGRPLYTEGATGFGMAHRHMEGYKSSGKCRLAAVADLDRGNAEAFVAHHEPSAAIYHDFRTMMQEVRPDVVSVCLWPHLHAEVVCATAEFRPRLILCEKPMDIHWHGALKMHATCQEHGVRLGINHQRRFNLPLQKARELLRKGTIGRLLRLEGAWHNLADTGTHALDMMFFFNEDTPAEWVLGQIEMRGSQRVFGGLNAGHGVTEFRFKNGVRATYHFGHQYRDFGFLIRLYGDEGEIDILPESPWLRLRLHSGGGWQPIETGESIHDDAAIYRGIADLLLGLEDGHLPELDSSRALRATEIIFATHESSRKRGRVDLPLPAGPCAMLDMLSAGELHEGN